MKTRIEKWHVGNFLVETCIFVCFFFLWVLVYIQELLFWGEVGGSDLPSGFDKNREVVCW